MNPATPKTEPPPSTQLRKAVFGVSLKRIATLFITLAGLATAAAQGLVEYQTHLTGANQVPPNSSPFLGDGRFWLDGTTFNFALGVYAPMPDPTGAALHGPAGQNSTAPIVFDLGAGFPVMPDGFNGGQTWGWGGAVTGLSSQQIADLEAGLWYVNLTSAAFPGGELRGQIQLVPEPSVLALLAIPALAFAFRRFKRL